MAEQEETVSNLRIRHGYENNDSVIRTQDPETGIRISALIQDALYTRKMEFCFVRSDHNCPNAPYFSFLQEGHHPTMWLILFEVNLGDILLGELMTIPDEDLENYLKPYSFGVCPICKENTRFPPNG